MDVILIFNGLDVGFLGLGQALVGWRSARWPLRRLIRAVSATSVLHHRICGPNRAAA